MISCITAKCIVLIYPEESRDVRVRVDFVYFSHYDRKPVLYPHFYVIMESCEYLTHTETDGKIKSICFRSFHLKGRALFPSNILSKSLAHRHIQNRILVVLL